MRKIVKEPEWFSKLAGDDILRSDDLRKLYGYAKNTSITALVQKGLVPEPTGKVPSLNERKRGPVYIWNVGYLRKIIIETRERRTAALKRLREKYGQARV